MSLMVSTGAEPTALSDVLKMEIHPSYCRQERTLLAGSGAVRSIALGTIVAIGALSIASAAGGGNTGDGAISGLALGAAAQPGVYQIECIEAATNAGVFSVIGPDNDRKEDLTVAVAYDNGEIELTLADGAADFVVGDSFTVTVTEGTEKVEALDLAGVDGSQTVVGVCLADATAADGADGKILILERGPAIVLRDQLTYPDGATTDQKAVIDAALEARGILVRDGV